MTERFAALLPVGNIVWRGVAYAVHRNIEDRKVAAMILNRPCDDDLFRDIVVNCLLPIFEDGRQHEYDIFSGHVFRAVRVGRFGEVWQLAITPMANLDRPPRLLN